MAHFYFLMQYILNVCFPCLYCWNFVLCDCGSKFHSIHDVGLIIFCSNIFGVCLYCIYHMSGNSNNIHTRQRNNTSYGTLNTESNVITAFQFSNRHIPCIVWCLNKESNFWHFQFFAYDLIFSPVSNFISKY